MLAPLRSLAPPCPTFGAGASWPVLDGARTVPRAGLHEGRAFGAPRRRLGLWHHWHCGVDLYADGGQAVLAIEPGEVVAWYRFYRSITGAMTWAAIVQHARCAVLYGELQTSQHAAARLSVGWTVEAGQVIGVVSREMRSPMLHLEAYVPGVQRNLRWAGRQSPPPAGLFDPTPALVELYL